MRTVNQLALAAMLSLAARLVGAASAEGESALLEDERNTVAVFEQASRGVVHVSSRVTSESKFEKAVVEAGTGSGFVIDAKGRILTNYHVVKGRNEIDVAFGSGRRFRGRLIGTAPFLDIALLEVDAPAEELVPLRLGDSKSLRVGQKVMAIGNPFGLHNALTVGVVSAVERSLPGTSLELQEALIQTDAAINSGNSGGPLLDSSGAVVGINTLAGEAEDLGFAVPIHLARQVVVDLIEMSHPYRPLLGLNTTEITPAVAALFGLPVERGLLVEDVLPRSAAALAGLRAGERLVVTGDDTMVLGGDIIVAVNGKPVEGSATLARAVLEARPGDSLRLEVIRAGERLEVTVALDPMWMQY